MRLLWSAAALVVASIPSVTADTNNTLYSTIASNPDLNAFANFLGSISDLIGELHNTSSITVFAPSNNAIAALGQDPALAAAVKDPNFLVALLRYHALYSTVRSTDFSSTPEYAHTLLDDSNYANVTGGQVVGLQKQDGNLTVTSGLKMKANIIVPDISLPNGVLHIIDSVLTIPPAVPPTTIAANLTAFGGALLKSSSSVDVASASDLTIFAPNNFAFANIAGIASRFDQAQLNDVIAYHVIPDSQGYSPLLTNTTAVTTLAGGSQTINVTCVDGGIFANAARVVFADILVAQGVMHVIDAVLDPNATAETVNPSATTPPILFPDMSSAGVTSAALWFTSGQSTPTTTNLAFSTTTDHVIAGYSTQPTRNPALATSTSSKPSSGGAASIPKPTGVAENFLRLGGGTVVVAAAAALLAA